MKKAFVLIAFFSLLVGAVGCGSAEDKALQSSAPPVSPGATAPAKGKDTSDLPEASGGEELAIKPEGM